METSILSRTHRYAACALFSLALNQSQHHQWRLSSTLPSLDEEPISEGMTAAPSPTVSDRPHLWIHEQSGLLLPVFRFMKVDDKAWDGLKETAGTSSQMRHHVGAFLKLLEDGGEAPSESADREHALLKSVGAMVSSMEGIEVSTLDSDKKSDEDHKFSEKYPHPISASEAAHGDTSPKEQISNAWEAMEVIVACSLLGSTKGEVEKRNYADDVDKWKQGGIIGATAVAGGTAMAVTGGIAAPAIAQGLSTVATAVGASGIAAAAASAGSIGGSIAIGASFGDQIRLESCLLRCCLKGTMEIGGLVERVVLLGAPVSLKDENWTLARKVVPGRFVNAYSTIDWTLGVVFRSSLASTGLAGIQPADVPGIENVDVTHLVDGHASYISTTEQILERLELESHSPVWKDL